MGNIDDLANDSDQCFTVLEHLMESIAEAIAVRVERITDTPQRLFDLEDAAKYLGMTVHALRHKAGVDIACVHIDGKLRFDKRDLDSYIDRAKRRGV